MQFPKVQLTTLESQRSERIAGGTAYSGEDPITGYNDRRYGRHVEISFLLSTPIPEARRVAGGDGDTCFPCWFFEP